MSTILWLSWRARSRTRPEDIRGRGAAFGCAFCGLDLRQAVAFGLVGVTVGELFASNCGLGYMIVRAAETYQTDILYAVVFLLAGLGILLTAAKLEADFSNGHPPPLNRSRIEPKVLGSQYDVLNGPCRHIVSCKDAIRVF